MLDDGYGESVARLGVGHGGSACSNPVKATQPYKVPEVIYTDQLRSYGAAIWEIPSLVNVDHQQVISTDPCNNLIEQEHRSTRRQERRRQGFRKKTSAGIPAPACPDHQFLPSFPH